MFMVNKRFIYTENNACMFLLLSADTGSMTRNFRDFR